MDNIYPDNARNIKNWKTGKSKSVVVLSQFLKIYPNNVLFYFILFSRKQKDAESGRIRS